MFRRKTLLEIQRELAKRRAKEAREIEADNKQKQKDFRQAQVQLKSEIEQWSDHGARELTLDGEGVSNPGKPFTVVFSSDVVGQFEVEIRLVEKPARHQRGWPFRRERPYTEKGEILTKWLKGLGWEELGVLDHYEGDFTNFQRFELAKRFGKITAIATVEDIKSRTVGYYEYQRKQVEQRDK